MGVQVFGRSGEQGDGPEPESAEWADSDAETGGRVDADGQDAEMGADGDTEKGTGQTAAEAIERMFEAYDDALSSLRDRDGKPVQPTELERMALMNRIRRRFAVNAKMPPGYNGALTVRETARRLGVTPQQVYRLCREGRLNGLRVNGHTYVPPEEVKAYRRLQQIWAAAGGRWTPYGRLEKQEAAARYRPCGDGDTETQRWRAVGRSGEESGQGDAETPGHGEGEREVEGSGGECWVTAQEAAAMMGLTDVRVRQMAKARGLERQTRHRSGPGRPEVCFRLEAIQRLLAERESKAWKRGIPPRDWSNDLRHPNIRTNMEAPPGDSLISLQEAAIYLGVSQPRVSELVAKGRLFGWQKQPGRSGSPLFLSARQVMRYAQDTMRQKRRLAATESAAPEELKTGNDWTEWREWHGLHRYVGCHSDRDRGEFLTAAQAAEFMGITPKKVKVLRQRGRLRGYKRRPGRQTWWFFRRDDVEDLLADPEYARHRRAASKAAQTSALNRRQSTRRGGDERVSD